VGHVTQARELRAANEVVMEKAEENRPLRRRRHGWEDNIKLDLKQVGWEDMFFIG
jgi:hypothetical protein